jgi:PIN domain nuclease of toxin-antitoxin system
MEAVADSHALYWFINRDNKLSAKARSLFLNAEIIVIPSIVLMEIFYILKKKKISSGFGKFLDEIKTSRYLIHPLDTQTVVDSLLLAENLEIHDAIITATASARGALLISKDREIKKYYSKTIW